MQILWLPGFKGRSPLGVIGGGAPWGFKGRSPLVRLRIREAVDAYISLNLNKWTPLSESLLALKFYLGGFKSKFTQYFSSVGTYG